MRYFLTFLLALVFASTLTFATPPASRIYGPFASSTPDSGTCGNNWATDTFDRYFHVMTTPNSDGTYTVTQQFKRGTFVTIAGQSPGACDPSGTPGGTVAAGITGEFQGKFTMIVSSGVYDPMADCSLPANCATTAGFVTAVFGPQATYDVPSFLFNYNAGPNGDWKNASADKGGNHGDITGQP